MRTIKTHGHREHGEGRGGEAQLDDGVLLSGFRLQPLLNDSSPPPPTMGLATHFLLLMFYTEESLTILCEQMEMGEDDGDIKGGGSK